jgi:tetratricopeptide (TPR) repeat protein
MLNNNFSKLVKLYKEYEKKRRNKRLLKLFGIIAIIGAAWLLYDQIATKQVAATASTNQSAQTDQSNSSTQAHTETAKMTPPETETKPLKKSTVETPKTESMPKQVTKRTPSRKKEAPFQLKVKQRESLYKLLVAYKDQKSYSAAIKIARFYYEEKEYEKAVKWAVEASKKDPTKADSWIVYAQAKKALGKPEVAKRALSIFLKHNHSQTAQNLLDSL